MALLFFTFIFIVGHLVKIADLVINKGVNFLDVFRIIILLIPRLFSYTLPTATITAILLVFGTMASNYEIVAMKASGINIFKVIIPVFLISIFLSIISLIMNDQILPKTHFAYRKAVKNILVKQPLAYIEAGRFIKEFNDYVIFVREIDGNELKNITIYIPQEGQPTRTVLAERGEIITDPVKKTISMRLYNGTTDEPDPDNPGVFNKVDFRMTELPPLHVGETGRLGKKTKDMTIDELVHEMKIDTGNIADQTHLINKLKAEIHYKIAFSFAPFVFALVGLPLALITRRGDVLISFLLSMIVITTYYVSFAFAKTIAVQGVILPSIALWIPNVLFIAIGIFLIIKVVRT
jgi:lipopolysaccharide export system permease protein